MLLSTLALALVLNTSASLPVCNVVVATDAPNPTAVVQHEMAHCWGWKHPKVKHQNAQLTSSYRSFVPPFRYRLLGMYPNMGDGIRFELSKDVLRLCDGGSAYGCQWGGLQDD